jgi:hypothetical protein
MEQSNQKKGINIPLKFIITPCPFPYTNSTLSQTGATYLLRATVALNNISNMRKEEVLQYRTTTFLFHIF